MSLPDLLAEGAVAPVRLAHEPRFNLGQLSVSPATREVLSGDERGTLQPRTMQVLTALARKRGAVVARDELIAGCWEGRTVGEDSLNRCILAIRKLARASGGFTITTVPRIGYRLDEAKGAIAALQPQAAWLTAGRAPLTGRDAEMAELRELLSRAMAGQGGLVLFAGEPGVGKTRLAEELCAEAARRGAFTFTGHCYETAGAPPYAPFAELLEQAARAPSAPMLREALAQDAAEVARICPELRKAFEDIPTGADLPLGSGRRYLFNAVRDVLERTATQRPLVLLLDDLHWADEATLDLLRHLTDRLAQTSLLVVGTHRNADIDIRGPFRDWWADVHRQRLGQQLVLRKLSEAGGVALIGELAGRRVPPEVAASIYRTTEGNPFFIEEVVRHLAEEGRLHLAEASDPEIDGFGVPQGVRLVVGKRLARLGADAEAVLTAAAVVGRPFTVEIVVAMGVGAEEEVLNATEAAAAAGILIGEAGALRFTHELIRQTLVARLSHARRQRMHLRVARAMEQVLGRRVKDHAADVGHHMLAAGGLADPEQTARYLLIAGHRSQIGAAFDEALQHFRAGLEAAPTGPVRIRAKLLYACGLVHRSIGPPEAAEAALSGSIDIYERLGDPEAGAQVYTSLAAHRHWQCDYDGAGAVLERGLAAIGGRNSARAELLTDLGYYHFLLGEFARGDALLVEAAELIFDEPRAVSRLAVRRSLRAWCSAEWPDSVRLAQEAHEQLVALGSPWPRSEARGHLAISLVSQGRWTEAEAPLAEGEALAFRLGHVWSQFLLLMSRAWLGLARPDAVETFERCADQLARLTEDSDFGLSFSRSRVWLGLAAWWRGRLEEAPAHFEAAVRTRLPVLFTDEGWAASLLFRARTGDVRGAEALLAERPEFLRRPQKGSTWPLGVWDRISATAEALVVLDRLGEAAQFHATLQDYLGRGAVVRWLDGRFHQTVLAMTAAAAGRWEEAEAGFAEALALAERLPHALEQADTRRDWAGALLRREGPGDRARALELLDEAAERYERLGMPSHAAAARVQSTDLARAPRI